MPLGHWGPERYVWDDVTINPCTPMPTLSDGRYIFLGVPSLCRRFPTIIPRNWEIRTSANHLYNSHKSGQKASTYPIKPIRCNPHGSCRSAAFSRSGRLYMKVSVKTGFATGHLPISNSLTDGSCFPLITAPDRVTFKNIDYWYKNLSLFFDAMRMYLTGIQGHHPR